MDDLLLSIETVEETNMGDHGERLRKSHQVVPGETVEDLVRRVFPVGKPFRGLSATDEIVIRLMVTADGKISGETTGSEDPF